MIGEWHIESGRRLIKLVLRSFQEWLRQTSNKMRQDRRSLGLESNRVLLKYGCQNLSLILGVMSSPGAEFGLAPLLNRLLQNNMPDCIQFTAVSSSHFLAEWLDCFCVYVSMVTSSFRSLKKVTESSSEPMTDVYFHSADGVANTGPDLSRR
jgi:hypothetical protein